MKVTPELEAAVKSMMKGIRGQKAAIRKAGFDPTWELFSATFGWHQLKRNLSVEQQKAYKICWKEVK